MGEMQMGYDPNQPQRAASRSRTLILLVLGGLLLLALFGYWMASGGTRNRAMDAAREQNQPAAVPEALSGAAVDPAGSGSAPAAAAD